MTSAVPAASVAPAGVVFRRYEFCMANEECVADMADVFSMGAPQEAQEVQEVQEAGQALEALEALQIADDQ